MTKKYRAIYHDADGREIRKGQGVKVPTNEADRKAMVRAEAKRARKRAKALLIAGASAPKHFIPSG
jgi:hypothetical protein